MTIYEFPPPTSGQPLSFEWSPVGASDEWDITHNLGFKPSGIVVIDSADTSMYGFGVEHVSNNRVILSFNAAFTGTAYLS